MKKRTFDFDKYVKTNRLKFFRNLKEFEEESKVRLVRERPRDPVEERLLIQLDKNRMEQMLKSGELKILGPRTWRLKIV
ncbi:MAG: hypothetical protein ACPL4K_01395 [Candidatus Margulisiibacteriota bacterium]